jgi:hypothetical protein
VRRFPQSRSVQLRALWRETMAPLPWRLTKPRSREAWSTWVADKNAARAAYSATVRAERAAVEMRRYQDWSARVDAAKQEAERTGVPVRLPAAPDFGEGMIFLNVDDPRIDGYVEPPEPQGLTPEQKRRRALADRLASILTENAPGDERAAYMVGGLSLPAKIGYTLSLREALIEAPQVAEASEPGSVKVASDVGGVVIRLHGPAWSLVFRYSPYLSPVLFVTDDMPERARRVDTDADWQPEIRAAIGAAMRELARYSLGGDKYVYRPTSSRARSA